LFTIFTISGIKSMKKRRLLLFLLLSLVVIRLEGQHAMQVPFFRSGAEKSCAAAIEKIKQSIQKQFAVPAHFGKEAKKIYEERRRQIEEDLAGIINQHAIYDDVLWPFVKNVHDKIIAANPNIGLTQVILTNNPTPNAFSVGDGTLVVYTGLLSELQNEDQLAFVLCHEIAHFVLRHATKQLVQNIEYTQSAAFKAQIKKVETAEFNRSALLEALFKNLRFQASYHHRDLERQADSLAYRLFLNTAYDSDQAIQLMEVFEVIDAPRDSALQLKQHFGCAQYPFQTKWTEREAESIWSAAVAAQTEGRKALADSLRTHPDSRKRLHWIAEMAKETNPPKRAPLEAGYAEIRFLSTLENVHAWYEIERYDRTVYWALLGQSAYPESAFFKNMLCLSLSGLFRHSKQHSLSEVLDQPSPYYEDKFNELLVLLNRLRLKDLSALQACFAPPQAEAENEYGLFAAYCYAQDTENREQINTLGRIYLKQYPKGRFAARLKLNKE
jgi:Zn-dependent protease with chaperone function